MALFLAQDCKNIQAIVLHSETELKGRFSLNHVDQLKT